MMKQENWPAIVVILALSLLLMGRQVLTDGYFSVLIEDSQAFVSWAWQFDQGIKAGVIYPRWMPLDFWGYGSPVFIQYPPLAYYLTSLYHNLGASLLEAINLVKLTSLFFYGFGVYLILKKYYGRKASITSTAIIICFPFNIFLFYYYGTYSSLFAVMFIPFTILYLLEFIETSKTSELVKAGICFGLLLASHLITAYSFALLLIAFWGVYCFLSSNYNKSLIVPKILLIGSAISAAYLVPLLVERKYIHSENFTRYPTGFDYKDFFLDSSVSPTNQNNIFWKTYSGFFADNAIFFSIIAFIFIFVYLVCRKKSNDYGNRVFELSIFSAFLFSLFMSLKASSILWLVIPYMDYVQFPFRWMVLAFFSAGILLAISLCKMHNFFKLNPIFYCLYLLILIAFLACDYMIINTSHVFYQDEILPAKQVNWTLEHLPKNVNLENLNKYPQPENRITIKNGRGVVHVIHENTADQSYKIDGETPLALRIGTFAFPGWTIYIDSQKVPTTAEENTGLILVNLAKGRHDLTVRFEDTLSRTVGKSISIASGLLALGYLYLNRRKI